MSRRAFLRGFAATGLLPWSLPADEPPAPDPLRIMKETFSRPLPSRFTAKSKLNWPGGVVSGTYEYHGSPQRCIIRSSLLSIGRLQGAPHTVHARRLVLYGGSWVDEELGVNPEHRKGHDSLVIETFRVRREDNPISEPQFTVRASRTTTFEPRISLAGVGIAFGYRHHEVFPELWASHPEETITLRPERERIDGVETVVVQFASAAGRRTLWVDPRQGMLPRQIEIEALASDVEPVGGAHRFTQVFFDDFPHGRRALYHAFRFETIGGQRWIAGFRAEFESDDQEGNLCTLKGEYDINDLQVGVDPPTEEELGEAVEIPADTRVEVQLPEGQGGRVGLWKEGRVRQGGVGFF